MYKNQFSKSSNCRNLTMCRLEAEPQRMMQVSPARGGYWTQSPRTLSKSEISRVTSLSWQIFPFFRDLFTLRCFTFVYVFFRQIGTKSTWSKDLEIQRLENQCGISPPACWNPGVAIYTVYSLYCLEFFYLYLGLSRPFKPFTSSLQKQMSLEMSLHWRQYVLTCLAT